MAKKSKNATAAPEARTAETKTAANMVTVAFNSPRGMIFPVGEKRIYINGNNHHLIGKEKGIISVGKYGYTRISADEWEAIQKAYGSMAIFKNGLMFAETTKDRAEERSDEQDETRHGLEPVDITKTTTEEATVGPE